MIKQALKALKIAFNRYLLSYYCGLAKYDKILASVDALFSLNHVDKYVYWMKIWASFESKKYVDSLECCERSLVIYGYDFDVFNICVISLQNLEKQQNIPILFKQYGKELDDDSKNAEQISKLKKTYYRE